MAMSIRNLLFFIACLGLFSSAKGKLCSELSLKSGFACDRDDMEYRRYFLCVPGLEMPYVYNCASGTYCNDDVTFQCGFTKPNRQEPETTTTTTTTTTTSETPIDPCALTICSNGGTPTASGSSCTCRCRPGYTGGRCNLDVNECLSNNGGCQQMCRNFWGGHECRCQAGYRLGADGKSCHDIDECQDMNKCDVNAVCQNTPGSYTCKCNAGYVGDGHTCTVADMCAGVTCQNGGTPYDNGFTCLCQCLTGYYGDRCEQKPPVGCSPPIDGVNSDHDYTGSGPVPVGVIITYTCRDGHYIPGGASTDMITCQKDGTYDKAVADCHPGCPLPLDGINAVIDYNGPAPVPEGTVVTYSCVLGNVMDDGTAIKAIECLSAGVYDSGPANCQKAGCAVNNGGCSHTCTNVNGGVKCSCSAGYVLGSDGKTCEDDDECAVRNGDCSHTCKNNLGGYKCECPSGYELEDDQLTCRVITPDNGDCAVNNGGCSHTCTNVNGGVKCSCSAGYVLGSDGKTCEDDDECALRNGDCSHTCKNNLGGYKCECPSGYELEDDQLTCRGPDPLCYGGQVWKTCGSDCTATCEERDTPPMCTLNCVARCECPPEKPYYHNFRCVDESECPTHGTNDTTGPIPKLKCPEEPDPRVYLGTKQRVCTADMYCGVNEKCCRSKISGCVCFPGTYDDVEGGMESRTEQVPECPAVPAPTDLKMVRVCTEDAHCDQRHRCCPVTAKGSCFTGKICVDMRNPFGTKR
ncbi:multiple epidermal growth factor-like domains protein 6 [Lingula anatina]|uniref:Multiple epidermal growth factor-like domains protein 6 n=1 Tax=Lingula anatina TaxID=7574 RepID=A0A1S3HGW1_LINAN|nr:multiple epidermal growth factor-like domains protein 6 [Lingula anatina]|eukprot:XP_013385287.1 multiple epidermal growth factor-like domains protein 6 [Lingula anatina]